MKKIVLIAGLPACGKTTLAEGLAKKHGTAVFLDKDDLTPLCAAGFACGGVPFDRDAPYYKEHLRDAEYETLNRLALAAAGFNDLVLVNAPYIGQVKTEGYLAALKKEANAAGAALVLLWVTASPAVCRARMIRRGAARDAGKLADWETYEKSMDFSFPDVKEGKDADRYIPFDNSGEETVEEKTEYLYNELMGG